MDKITSLFVKWGLTEQNTVVQLINYKGEPVAALYLNKLNFDQVAITEVNLMDKYYLYIDGVGIFFSTYKKIPVNS